MWEYGIGFGNSLPGGDRTTQESDDSSNCDVSHDGSMPPLRVKKERFGAFVPGGDRNTQKDGSGLPSGGCATRRGESPNCNMLQHDSSMLPTKEEKEKHSSRLLSGGFTTHRGKLPNCNMLHDGSMPPMKGEEKRHSKAPYESKSIEGTNLKRGLCVYDPVEEMRTYSVSISSLSEVVKLSNYAIRISYQKQLEVSNCIRLQSGEVLGVDPIEDDRGSSLEICLKKEEEFTVKAAAPEVKTLKNSFACALKDFLFSSERLYDQSDKEASNVLDGKTVNQEQYPEVCLKLKEERYTVRDIRVLVPANVQSTRDDDPELRTNYEIYNTEDHRSRYITQGKGLELVCRSTLVKRPNTEEYIFQEVPTSTTLPLDYSHRLHFSHPNFSNFEDYHWLRRILIPSSLFENLEKSYRFKVYEQWLHCNARGRFHTAINFSKNSWTFSGFIQSGKNSYNNPLVSEWVKDSWFLKEPLVPPTFDVESTIVFWPGRLVNNPIFLFGSASPIGELFRLVYIEFDVDCILSRSEELRKIPRDVRNNIKSYLQGIG